MPGEWVCLRFKRSALKTKFGIHVRDEEAMPVGAQAVGSEWGAWVCPHVLGGLPPAVVDKEFPMTRDGSAFVAIVGLTDPVDADGPRVKAAKK